MSSLGGSVATGGAPDGAQPTDAVVTPPSAAFVGRAELVAKAVIAAGLDKPSTQVMLESRLDQMDGFETDAQKVAWNAGHVTLGPGITPTGATASQVVLPDGRKLPVDVLPAQAALDAALASNDAGCSGVSDEACRLVITSGRLTTTRAMTTAGEATVPAWSFDVEGLAQPVLIIAASSTQLPLAPLQPPTPPGLPRAGDGYTGAGSATVDAQGRLSVGLSFGDCDTDIAGHVVEISNVVVVGGTLTPQRPGTTCTLMRQSQYATFTLARPLGDRVVVSVSTGAVLPVHRS